MNQTEIWKMFCLACDLVSFGALALVTAELNTGGTGVRVTTEEKGANGY
jgi:hypothetical protein